MRLRESAGTVMSGATTMRQRLRLERFGFGLWRVWRRLNRLRRLPRRERAAHRTAALALGLRRRCLLQRAAASAASARTRQCDEHEPHRLWSRDVAAVAAAGVSPSVVDEDGRRRRYRRAACSRRRAAHRPSVIGVVSARKDREDGRMATACDPRPAECSRRSARRPRASTYAARRRRAPPAPGRSDTPAASAISRGE